MEPRPVCTAYYAYLPVPVLQVPVGEERGPSGLPNTLKEGEKEEDWEEKLEDDDDEEEIEGKRRDTKDMQDSLVVEEGMIIKFPLVSYAILKRLLQCSFHQEEIKQPHHRDTQKPNIMNYLPVTTLPGLPEQCSHFGVLLFVSY